MAYRKGHFWSAKKGTENENYDWKAFASNEGGRDSRHPTSKPVALMQHLVELGSEVKMNILDLFGGSGSTLIACEKTNRKCYMMELDPYYCDVIIQRWQKYSGKKAILKDPDKGDVLYDDLSIKQN